MKSGCVMVPTRSRDGLFPTTTPSKLVPRQRIFRVVGHEPMTLGKTAGKGGNVAKGTFNAKVAATSTNSTQPDEKLTVERFVDLGNTPGNVGICLSGGGSRALTAGMGQLRALRALRRGDKSLLDLSRAMSTVSGGSWLGVTFQFLPDSVDDDAFLNAYVADPGRLVPTATAGHSQAETLDELPAGNIGTAVNSPWISPEALALQAFLLFSYARVPAHSLWQTLVGMHILEPFDLFDGGPFRGFAPTSLFTYDPSTLKTDVLDGNPGLDDVTAHLTAAGAGRSRRPFLVCNTAVFTQPNADGISRLAPVQSTPFFTGVVGAPDGRNADGRLVGGGGVTSFAFASDLQRVNGEQVAVGQDRQWALTDAVGCSSAFFAEILENQVAVWQRDADLFLRDLELCLEDLWPWLDRYLHPADAAVAKSDMGRVQVAAARMDRAESSDAWRRFQSAADSLRDIIPQYKYWPVREPAVEPKVTPSRFADGGNLENLGLADLLSYQDIERALVFVNTSTRIAVGAKGAIDPSGREIPGTRVVVTSQIPPLFGYQPYSPHVGYRLYSAGQVDPANLQFQNSQVFESSAFADYLKALWSRIGNDQGPETLPVGAHGANQKAALVKQTLNVVANPWFGVSGVTPDGQPRRVEVLWSYLDRVRDWYEQLSPEVQAVIGDFDERSSFHGFPNYSTLRSRLSAIEINLMASLTAWCVAAPENRELFLDMFQ